MTDLCCNRLTVSGDTQEPAFSGVKEVRGGELVREAHEPVLEEAEA